MDLKKFTQELITEWQKLPKNQRGLAGVAENKEIGLKGEKSALNNLKNGMSGYEFTLTPNSKSPADIIGFKKSSDLRICIPVKTYFGLFTSLTILFDLLIL